MGISLLGPLWLALLALALVGSIAWSLRTKSYAALSWRSIVAMAVPGAIMVVGFYVLALHMHAALGGWPTSIGDAGFPPALVTHARWTLGYFGVMLLSMIFVWPVAVGICAAIPRLRRFIPHLSLLAVSFCLCFGLMLLGPSPFLNWWWD